MKTYKVALLTLITILVVGCGGGGGGGGTSYVAPSVTSTTYSGSVQTIHYSDGSAVTNNASSSSASWASDHVTKTTSYTYANGGANTAVETVTPTAGTPSYSINTQTITSTYGDGYTSTATNTATSSPVTWASDHITKTTTYTFANGGTNPVVATVNPTVSTPTLTAAVYPGNWTTVGAVTAPTVSAKNNVYGDGYTSAIEDGSISKPFMQTTLSAISITDPSKYVTSATTTYNLTWGTPDKNGPSIASLFPATNNHLSSDLSYAGITVSGQGVTGPILVKPSADVLAAWNAGWTGNGTNVLLIDDYANRAGCTYTNGNCHGIMTMMNVDMTAPGATKFGLDFTQTGGFATATAINGNDGANLGTSKNIGVTNLSFTFDNSWNCNNGCGIAPSSAAYNAGIASAAQFNSAWVNLLAGSYSVSNLNNLSNAVITKAAGNNALDSKYDTLTLALTNNSSTAARLLVVGALDKTGSVSSLASLASYSNFSGSNSAIANRFVLANGNMPFVSGGVSINGSAITGVEQGTSFAAPIVAGYAAVVMQKFPNLTAANTSNIILDTARTDTLSCTPNCDPAIYGKGEASLSRALAPVGRLR